jgi:glutamate 5-kinase
MLSKINAAKLMNMQGINVIIGNGNFSVFDLINNPQIRTIFKSNNLNNHNLFE